MLDDEPERLMEPLIGGITCEAPQHRTCGLHLGEFHRIQRTDVQKRRSRLARLWW
jgi:hypothetical protein